MINKKNEKKDNKNCKHIKCTQSVMQFVSGDVLLLHVTPDNLDAVAPPSFVGFDAPVLTLTDYCTGYSDFLSHPFSAAMQ